MSPSNSKKDAAPRMEDNVRRHRRSLHFLTWFLGAAASFFVGSFVAIEICFRYLGVGIGLGGGYWGGFIAPLFFTCGFAIWHVFICNSADSAPTRIRFWILHLLVPLLLFAAFVFLTTESESGVSALETLLSLHGL